MTIRYRHLREIMMYIENPMGEDRWRWLDSLDWSLAVVAALEMRDNGHYDPFSEFNHADYSASGLWRRFRQCSKT